MTSSAHSSIRITNISISSFFLFLYMAYGSFYPLLSLYLKGLHLNGTQMGAIMSIGALMQLFLQPLWGLLCDYTQRLRMILTITLCLSAGIVYLFAKSTSFTFLLAIAMLLSFFQSAVNPISDSIVMSYVTREKLDYGRFRMWGAIGFASSAWAVGILAQTYGLKIIFYSYAIFFLLATVTVLRLPHERITFKQSICKGLNTLFRIPQFLLLLLASFCILGPMLSNNSFFGPYFQSIGGTIAGVGLCFFIGAGSETPFMKWANNWIQRYGVLSICIAAGLVSFLQYTTFTLKPPIEWIYFLSLSQGFSIGLFIPASLQYVQEITPAEVQTTAIASYSAISYGFGNWFFVFIGGWIMDRFNVVSIYLFYGLLTFVGVILLLFTFLLKAEVEPK